MTTESSGSGDISRSLDLLWDRDAKPTRGPKPALTLDDIVLAAIEIADADGLDALSMRRVAERLGVGTMSLYRYVPGKAELLDLMLDRVVAPLDGASLSGDWRSAMAEMGRAMWRLYTEHAWLPFVDQSRPLLGPGALAGFEIALAGLDDTRLTAQQKVNVISLIETVVAAIARMRNAAYQAEERTGVSGDEFWETQAPVLKAAMATGRFPRVAGLSEDAFAATPDEFLEFALALVLDGLAGLVEGAGGGGAGGERRRSRAGSKPTPADAG
jgi:AcrR family transcriptional regulator